MIRNGLVAVGRETSVIRFSSLFACFTDDSSEMRKMRIKNRTCT